jgi:hypothetical protein
MAAQDIASNLIRPAFPATAHRVHLLDPWIDDRMLGDLCGLRRGV